MTEYTPGEPATWTWPDAYGDDMSELDRTREELAVVKEQLEVAIDRSQSWKNLADKYKELADARGEAIDQKRKPVEVRTDGDAIAVLRDLADLLESERAEVQAMQSLLARLVANQDTRCSLDHHGYCQEHNFAAPCPVPESQRITGTGVVYVPNPLGGV